MTRQEAIKTLREMAAQYEWERPLDWQVAIDMAIEALKTENDKENRYARTIYNFLKKKIGTEITDNVFEFEGWFNRMTWHVMECYRLQKKLDEALKDQEWIPVKWHEITDEEREREGYPKDWSVHLDCDMPADEEEIIITTRYGTVEKDVCYADGEFSLDSGYDWIEDVTAWKPLPKPYKGGEENA